MASMCTSCIFNDDEEEGFCIALEQQTNQVTDEECDCYQPIFEVGDDD